MNRRSFLGGLTAILAAPAIIRTPGLLMPVRVPRLLTSDIVLVVGGRRIPVAAETSDGIFAAMSKALLRVPGPIQDQMPYFLASRRARIAMDDAACRDPNVLLSPCFTDEFPNPFVTSFRDVPIVIPDDLV